MSRLLAICVVLIGCAARLGAEDNCPSGAIRMATDDPYEPFRCVAPGAESRPYLKKLDGFKIKPKCPKGFAPRLTPGSLQRYRCVAEERPAEDPDIAPVVEAPAPQATPGVNAFPEGQPFPVPAVRRAPAKLGEYARYAAPGSMRVDYPKGWRVNDAWHDEVPSVYFELDTGRDGRQVILTVAKYERSQTAYFDMDTAHAKEIEWRNAADGGRGSVGGCPARFAFVEKDSRSAFVEADKDGTYYVLSYSAPEDLFKEYEPAWDRLLKSFRLLRPAGRR